jgi:hypothetical protein
MDLLFQKVSKMTNGSCDNILYGISIMLISTMINKMLALTSVYPEYQWDVSRFRSVPSAQWKNNLPAQKAFFDRVAQQLSRYL